MKKSVKNIKTEHDFPLSIVEEAGVQYITERTAKREVVVKEFTYNDFKKIAEKAPFSLADWAEMLYISERSLHRYANDDGSFNGLQIERILHLEKLIDAANELFGAAGFRNWLSYKPFSLNGHTVKEMLQTYYGIQDVIDLIGRMEHGIAS